jgi:hypothetical protein
MIKPKKSSSADNYALVDGDFVNAKWKKNKSTRSQSGPRGKTSGKVSYTVAMTFTPYMDLYKAIIDGIDEVEVIITDREKFELDFFSTEKTPQSTANDISGFFVSAKKELINERQRLAIHSEEFNITDFVRDRDVARMGRGRINKRNYLRHVPVQDVLSVTNYKAAKSSLENPIDAITTEAIHTGSLSDERGARDLAYDTFDNAGYDPAMISQVYFPVTGKEARANGTSSGRINPKDQTIPAFGTKREIKEPIFYELHKKFFKSIASEVTRYSLVERPYRIKYLPVKFRLRFEADQESLNKLILKRRLYLMLSYKKNNIVVKTEKFAFNSRDEFEKAKTKYKPLDLRCKAGDPAIAEGDKISLRNPNNFPLRYVITETSVQAGQIKSKKIKSGLIRRKSVINFERITTVFGSVSESRSYRVMSNRIGGTILCNIDEIVSPSTTKKPSYESQFPVIYASKAQKNSSVVSVKNTPVDADLIKIFRKDLGTKRSTSGKYFLAGNATVGKCLAYGSSRKFVLTTLKDAGTFMDYNKLYHDSTYEYSAEFYSNGGKLPVEVSTVLHYMDDSDISKSIKFNINEKSTSRAGNTVVHKFKIEESLDKSAADKLLSTVNTIGQQSAYQEELEEIKDQTGTITRYSVERVNIRTGQRKLVSSQALPDAMQTFVVEKNIRDSYKYIVSLSAAPAAGMSFTTAATAIDTTSGQEYKYSYRKWRGQQTFDDEALPSTIAVTANNVATGVKKSGKFTSVTFSGISSAPKIARLNTSRDKFNDCNWLEWTVRGNTDFIDHFLVLAFYNGIQAPIGAAGIPEGKNKSFLYRDKRMFGLLGEVIYQVIIVYKDFTYYTNTPESSVKYLSTVPRITLAGSRGG